MSARFRESKSTVQRIRRRERGAALVETVVIIPALLVLVMGVIDVGRLLSTSAKVQEAAQEGALFASYSPGDHLDTRDRIVDSLGDFNLDTTKIEVVCAPDDAIEVSIDHDVDLLTPWISSMLGNTVTISGQAVGKNFTDDTCDPTPSP